ncbi:hypothetical protein [Falsiroseomonas selenitidurans]|uniref:Uncharacterized protein n=1 Tax=Falsiroseomonas selenitidurans TaxID=2716335 RepID=A0ABX1E7K3_9PROT|nr:hypothetical protein [Falsiroseomonas selenitidurans]NKC31793.1 hypothetical protein [Falsiroseomonas selenitidurans]
MLGVLFAAQDSAGGATPLQGEQAADVAGQLSAMLERALKAYSSSTA